ncbi:hypothetical protein BT96DRAFT_1021389 [Gymnopus androsaceus JB14]|uniref:MYND-type domain-containing protein n=1 Tax=Gymnopus androsaceus JB14 TaxID=1447944 RepID=A0A6A4HGS6_9AGAR|nr:hypothetical protein BT96DRAFT_1021389 [Gymnopus androsaceus JB14]
MRVPPLTARIGQACHSCFTDSSGTNLSRCSKCMSVAYCSAECQKRDWTSHKAICKALHAVENDGLIISDYPTAPSSDSEHLNSICTNTIATNLMFLVGGQLGNRPMNVIEQNIVAFEPKCLACLRSNRVLRVENSDPKATLHSCPDCGLAFFCSDEHWNVVANKHKSEPCDDGYGLSQCAVNQNMRVDTKFANVMVDAGGPFGIFQWAPERFMSSWVRLPEEADWDGQYGNDLRMMSGGGGPPLDPFLRGSSEALSFPLTILYALQNLNEDDAWTKKDTLTIHILGASSDKEVLYGMVFEEILHRLPKVKTLQLLLCGPDLKKIIDNSGQAVNMDTCPKYHEYAQKQGSGYIKPDLAIAFNSGAFQLAVESWTETIKFLVAQKIPAAFTSYNREEAEAEASILRSAGGNLIPGLGPRRNPWGSQVLRPEPTKITGFFATNGWLSGGFH